MRKLTLFAMICALLLLVSCGPAAQECEEPFIPKDGGCCVDLNDDNVCDSEQNETEEKEAEIFVEEKEPIEVDTSKKKEEPKEEKEEEITQEITGTATAEVTEEDIEEFEKTTGSIDASDLLKSLMKTYTEEVESYKYNHNSDWYFIYGNHIKIKLSESRQFVNQRIQGNDYPLFVIDTVYLDILNKTATGYCEGNDPRLGKRRCAELDIIDIPFPVNYGQFYTKKPDEWLFEVYTLDPEVKTETGDYYLGPRKVKRLEYQDGIKQVIMFYDETIGLPVKIQSFINGQPNEIVLYDLLSINTVKKKHVDHRSADEISSKEGFYSTAN